MQNKSNESNSWNFLIQDTILLIFNRADNNDTDMFGLPAIRNIVEIARDNFRKIVDRLKDQQFNIKVIDNDQYEDGIYFQINGKEITAGIMISLDQLNNGDINTLKNYLINNGLSQSV
jgi:hypothetical protein